MMNNPFFVMKNNHVRNCGEPSLITNDDPNKYYGYFENEHGEQWVFVYDRRTKTAELSGGDVGWEQVFQIKNGHNDDLILNEEEKTWIQACWKAASAFSDI